MRSARPGHTMPRPSKRSSLALLTRAQLMEVARGFELDARSNDKRATVVDLIARSKRASFERVLGVLKRQELEEICRAHGLPDGGRAKAPIVDRIMGRDSTPSLPGLLEAIAIPEPPEPELPVPAEPALTLGRRANSSSPWWAVRG